MISFSVHHQQSPGEARVGVLGTSHGSIPTPAFMPVGTLGVVKGIDPDELRQCGFGLMLSNAYHLYLRPGHSLIAEQGGLHKFAGWSGALLTDSGGFQMVSLSDLCQVKEDGVVFASHLDGSRHHLTPELCIEIQVALGSDIMMVLDECPPYPCSPDHAKAAVQRTTRWARRCRNVFHGPAQGMFGIVQGGLDQDLRRRSARDLTDIGFEGYAIGGLSLGEKTTAMFEMVETTVAELPKDRPRYLMGVGMPEDLVEGVYRGVDMFDCVLPSRHGRTGWLFTSTGRVLIKQARHARDDSPIDPQCRCPVCQRFSRAYLRHLFISNDMLGCRLNTLHNLWYYATLMSELREAIQHNQLPEYRAMFYAQRAAGQAPDAIEGLGSRQRSGSVQVPVIPPTEGICSC